MNIIETNLKFRGSMSNRKSTNRIILHHAEAASCTPEQIHQWHLNNGWSGAGYHFLVRKDGSIYRLRPEDKIGAHASGSNSDSIGICFEGRYQVETMPEAQINAGKELVAHLKGKYGISKVLRHKDVCSTDCPGNNFPFDQIAGVAASSGGQQAPAPKPTPRPSNSWADQVRAEAKRQGFSGVPTCRKGAKGGLTRLIQQRLIALGFSCGKYGADGSFGAATESAVRAFQRSRGLTADGIVGKNTWAALGL